MQLQPDQAALIIELSTARTSDTNNKAHRTESTWTHPINLTTSLTTCGTKYRAGHYRVVTYALFSFGCPRILLEAKSELKH